ncbi:MAG: hypothetical protein FWF47_06750 [Clostridia bacterium]|nr:hypothetical protein [Clostridia bacterium]
MTKKLQARAYGEEIVRTIDRKGELWWVLKDVRAALRITQSSAMAVIDKEHMSKHYLGRPDEIDIISEDGLYTVCAVFNDEDAHGLRRWAQYIIVDFEMNTLAKSIEKTAEPLMRILAEKYNPHCRIVVSHDGVFVEQTILGVPRMGAETA